MSDARQPEAEPQPNEADERARAEEEAGEPLGRSLAGSSYGASSSESGGNYDLAGPTTANTEGEPMDADETTSEEPSPS